MSKSRKKKTIDMMALAGVASLILFGIYMLEQDFTFADKQSKRLIVQPMAQGSMRDKEPLEKLPNFEVENLKRSDLRGGHFLVNIFASWCTPCRAEHPYLQDLSQIMPVYGIAFEDERANTHAFLRELGNPYIQIGYDYNGTLKDTFELRGIPETFMVERKTYKIIYRHSGPITPRVADIFVSKMPRPPLPLKNRN